MILQERKTKKRITKKRITKINRIIIFIIPEIMVIFAKLFSWPLIPKIIPRGPIRELNKWPPTRILRAVVPPTNSSPYSNNISATTNNMILDTRHLISLLTINILNTLS